MIFKRVKTQNWKMSLDDLYWEDAVCKRPLFWWCEKNKTALDRELNQELEKEINDLEMLRNWKMQKNVVLIMQEIKTA